MTAVPRHPAEGPLELGAAAVPAAASAYAAATLAPFAGWPGGTSALIVAPLVFLAAYGAMRAAGGGDRNFALPPFALDGMDGVERSELLLDTLWNGASRPEETMDQSMSALAELILDDPLARPDPNSRVVRLFEPPAPQSPEGLRQSIDRHRATGGAAAAGDPLTVALKELKRSLGHT